MFKAVVIVFAVLAAFNGGDCAVTFTTPASTSATISPSLAEGTAAGTTIYTAVATSDGTTSGGAAASVTYSVKVGTGWFGNTAGAITNTYVLDYETGTSFVLQVLGTDDASTVASASVTLTLSITSVATDPYFGAIGYCVVMADLSASGSTVTTLTATDPNSDTLTYSILAGSNTNTDFAISSAGVVTTANILYGLNTKSYDLVLYAADASLSGTTTLSVCVGTSSQCSSCTTSSGATIIAVNVMMTFFALLLVLLR